MFAEYLKARISEHAGADPGFPVGGGASLRGGGGANIRYDFAKFCEKLHEIEKILGRGPDIAFSCVQIRHQE